MKKLIVFISLLVAAFAVHAAPSAGLVASPPVVVSPPVVPPPIAPAESCKPPSDKYVRTGSVGPNLYYYYWCDAEKFRWSYLIPGDANAEQLKIDTAYWLGLEPVIKPRRASDDPLVREIWAAASAAIKADADRPPAASGPPPVVAVVAPNGTYQTRPAYPVIDGAPGTKEAGRATIGQPCGCSAIKIMKGTVMYCAAPAPNSALVTVCRMP